MTGRPGRSGRPNRLGRRGRLISGTAAWAAGTAVAVALAWLGAQVVLRDAVSGGQPAPVLGAATPAPRPGDPPSPSPSDSSSPSGRPSPGVASPAPAPAPAPSRPGRSPGSGVVRSYALTGGHVTLLVAAASVQLVAATPAAGFSVQTWSAAGWLRVDFSGGSGVSSLIATWNSGAPTVQTFND
jgi:hypothetical protein